MRLSFLPLLSPHPWASEMGSAVGSIREPLTPEVAPSSEKCKIAGLSKDSKEITCGRKWGVKHSCFLSRCNPKSQLGYDTACIESIGQFKEYCLPNYKHDYLSIYIGL